MLVEMLITLVYNEFSLFYNKMTDLSIPTFTYTSFKRLFNFWLNQNEVSGHLMAMNLLTIWCYYIRIYSISVGGVVKTIIRLTRKLLKYLAIPDWLKQFLIDVGVPFAMYAESVNRSIITCKEFNLDLMILLVLMWKFIQYIYVDFFIGRHIKSSIHREIHWIYVRIDHWIYIRFIRVRYPHQRKSDKINSRKLELQHGLSGQIISDRGVKKFIRPRLFTKGTWGWYICRSARDIPYIEAFNPKSNKPIKFDKNQYIRCFNIVAPARIIYRKRNRTGSFK